MRYVARQLGAMREALGQARRLEVAPVEAVTEPAAPLHRPISVYQPPSTLSFLTSRYAITLALLAILVNRIRTRDASLCELTVSEHIVPPRRMFELRDWTRVAIRLPSIVLLSEAVLLVAGQMSSVGAWMPSALLRPEIDVQRVLWSTFLALAVSCVSETFVRALDNECVIDCEAVLRLQALPSSSFQPPLVRLHVRRQGANARLTRRAGYTGTQSGPRSCSRARRSSA